MTFTCCQNTQTEYTEGETVKIQISNTSKSKTMASDEPSAEVVEESTLSPIERQDSLEKHLQTRPDAQDLKNRHILLDTNAAP